MSRKLFSFLLLNMLLCALTIAQETIPVAQILENLQKQHQVQFNYASSILEDIEIRPLSRKQTLQKSLTHIEKQSLLRFSKVNENIISITKLIKICGVIKDGLTGEILNNASIYNSTEYTTVDASGYFQITVPSTEKKITISFIGYKTIERKAQFFSQKSCKDIVLYPKEEQLASIIISSYLIKGIDKLSNGSTSIDFSKFTLLPGLIDADVLYSTQALPGIFSIDETVSNINIRGGSNDQNLVLWDDIKMYQTGHFFGLISSFNPEITESTTLNTNGTKASYSDGVSGMISMQTAKEVNPHFKASMSLNFLSANAFTDIPVSNNSSIQLAVRKSINQLLETPTYTSYFDRITQSTEVTTNEENVINAQQTFDFYDTSLRYLYKISDNDLLRVNFIANSNDLTFTENAIVNNIQESRNSKLTQASVSGGLFYKKNWSKIWNSSIQIYNTDYTLNAINANVIASQRFFQENKVSETGIRIKNANKLSENLEWIQGYQGIETEITNLNDIDIPRFRELRSNVVRTHALYSQLYYNSSDKSLQLNPGLRANYVDKFGVFIIEPRLHASKKITKELQIEFQGEFKHQTTSQVINFQNDFLGVEKRRWQLTDNDSIPILKSKQVSLGTSYSKNGWLLDLEGYYKTVAGITSQSQGFTTKYEFSRAQGSYDVVGLDLLARKRIGKLNTWLSYSYMDNNYTFISLEDYRFPSNFDSSHSISFGSTYTGRNYKVSAGLNWRSGAPTTIPEDGNEIINQEINFAIANDQRLQDYFRIDLSGVYKFKLSTRLRSEIGASIWNVTNQTNTINNYYRINSNGQIQEFNRESLGFTSNLVFRLIFE